MATNDGLKLDIRRNKILEMLNQSGKVRVSELSETLGASEVTIRNDLTELEKGGYLERVSGGAVQTMNNYYNMDLLQRKNHNAPEKQSAASSAMQLIHDGDTLFINAGTTAYFAALELKRFRNLKIVTNSILIGAELGTFPTFNIQLLGGYINPQYSFTHGSIALEQLKQYRADKAILSIDGVCSDAGLTTYHNEEAEVSRLMMERSHGTIVVADYSKIGRESFFRIADLSSATYLITNRRADAKILKKIEACGVTVITD